jgi:large subunit ribosomal protein L19
MSHSLLQSSTVVTSQLRTDIPEFKVGSVVDVHYKIKEGNKERVQVFSGVVTNAHAGNGLDATFTVLRNSTAGVKVERTFPLHSPLIEKVVLASPLQQAKRANLKHLRTVKDPLKSVKTKPLKQKQA